jgi:hypothetical protein
VDVRLQDKLSAEDCFRPRMHTQEMSELDGTFNEEKPCDRKCPKCGSAMTVRVWDSSCGGYEDEKFTCTNKECGHSYWVDGPDS